MYALFYTVGFLMGAIMFYGFGHIRGVIKTDKIHSALIQSALRATALNNAVTEARKAQSEAYATLNLIE